MQLSYSTNDITLVDWNAALLIDSEGDDLRALLDFANVELLEMRYVDQKLDRALDQAHETLSRRSWRSAMDTRSLRRRPAQPGRVAGRQRHSLRGREQHAETGR